MAVRYTEGNQYEAGEFDPGSLSFPNGVQLSPITPITREHETTPGAALNQRASAATQIRIYRLDDTYHHFLTPLDSAYRWLGVRDSYGRRLFADECELTGRPAPDYQRAMDEKSQALMSGIDRGSNVTCPYPLSEPLSQVQLAAAVRGLEDAGSGKKYLETQLKGGVLRPELQDPELFADDPDPSPAPAVATATLDKVVETLDTITNALLSLSERQSKIEMRYADGNEHA